ncbi:MAG: DNA polymerase III subunit delta [Bacteroidetes bacterium CG23_combo_of_CG06-09_8_20_14_all_32_9]|nr:MAG: DNA polymerase III subunit delta [Bacteroidetes bacterium CG23_combo_of_CG06-09_8_20_14_all_32_9]
MLYEQIIKDLKNKIYKPIYYLMGDEAYYIDKVTDFIANNVLTEAEQSFNQSILYGKDVDLGTVITASRRFPMMANYQVIIIKEAQNIKGIDGSDGPGKSKKPNSFLLYAESPPKSTILVINLKYKSLDKNRKLYKALEKNGVILESKRLYDSKLPEWISSYLAKRHLKIDLTAATLMADFIGSDLCKISNEIEKLLLVLPKESKVITPELIEKHIGISKEFNNFELQKAIGNKEILKANRIINYFGKNPTDNPVFLTIKTLFDYFVKILIFHYTQNKSRENLSYVMGINPYFIAEYINAAKNYPVKKTISNISILRQFDMKSKGVDVARAQPDELLKELVYRLIH